MFHLLFLKIYARIYIPDNCKGKLECEDRSRFQDNREEGGFVGKEKKDTVKNWIREREKIG